MENKRILVIGGTGYIGKEIVGQLLKKGCIISILSRKIKGHAQFNVLNGSVLDKLFLMQNLKDFDVVVYLAAIIRTLRKARYHENVVGIENTIKAMIANKIKKLIYFSTQNVHIKETGPYGNSKKFSEQRVASSPLDYVILRPNYVYGIDKCNDFFRLIKILSKARICPILGSGNTRFQPINKMDVALMTINIIENYPSRSMIDISGNTTITLNEVVDFFKMHMGIKFIRVNIPMPFLRPFKKLFPFDIDGYESDRLAVADSVYKPSFDLKMDLKKIIALNRQ